MELQTRDPIVDKTQVGFLFVPFRVFCGQFCLDPSRGRCPFLFPAQFQIAWQSIHFRNKICSNCRPVVTERLISGRTPDMFAVKHGIEATRQHEEQTYEVFRTECLVASLSEEMAGNAPSDSHSEQAYSHDD